VVRALVCLLLALAAVAASPDRGASATCRPTESDVAGPFGGRGLGVPLRAKIGTGHVLTGRVLAPDCRPVARALVVFWQSGPKGYTARGRGSVRTDKAGRFRFEGPIPSAYGFEPHIHILVLHPAYEELLTRYVVPRGEKRGNVRLVLTPLL
jgi:protocatechuate 3,4-dioxygenase beta subunit